MVTYSAHVSVCFTSDNDANTKSNPSGSKEIMASAQAFRGHGAANNKG